MLWTWLANINKRLWWALAISIALHFLLIAGSEDWLPNWLPDDDRLEVTLAPPPAPVVKPAPRPTPAAPKPKPIHVAPQKPTPATPEPIVAPEPIPQPNTAPPVQAVAENTPEPTPAPPVETQQESPPAVEEPAQPVDPVNPPPKHLEMEFHVDYDGASAVDRHSYQAIDDSHYVVSSTAAAKGLFSLALSDLNQKSTGRITAQGLRPEIFSYQYGNSSKKAQKASFDWAGKTLTMEFGANKQTAPLEDGTQDQLSFLYQFMFTPPLEQFQLTITNGKQLKTYHYLFEGEEQLKTNLGVLRTLHLSKSSGKAEEKTEIWLAEDYHYLPVKIRKIDSNGKVIQHTISSIKITP